MIKFFKLIFFFLFITSSYANITFEEIETNDGSTIWYKYTDTSPLVSMRIVFPVGSVQDPEDKSGVSAITAATMDEGAGNYNSSEFRSNLKKNNINFYYSKSHKFFTLNISFFKFDQKVASEMTKLSLSQPRFENESIYLIKNQMLASLSIKKNNASNLAYLLSDQSYFQKHPFGKSENGTLSGIKDVTRKDLINFKNLLSKKDSFISIVGNISRDEAVYLCEDIISVLPSKPKSKIRTINRYKNDTIDNKFFTPMDVTQASIILQTNSPLRNDIEFTSNYVAAHILGGGGLNSLLADNLRENNGLTYHISSYLLSDNYASRFIISYSTQIKNIEKSLEAVKEVLSNVKKNGISSKELSNAIRFIKGSYNLKFNTNEQISYLAQVLWENNLSPDYAKKRNKLYDNLTPEIITKSINKILSQPFQKIVVGGKEIPAGFKVIKKQDIRL